MKKNIKKNLAQLISLLILVSIMLTLTIGSNTKAAKSSFTNEPYLYATLDNNFEFSLEDITKSLIDSNTLISSAGPTISTYSGNGSVSRTMTVETSAYTSREIETDSTPFIMADNTHVYWGAVASNRLPFGTQFRIPDYFGDKIFTVHDRTAKKYEHRIDIWHADLNEAYQWGVRNVKIEILET